MKRLIILLAVISLTGCFGTLKTHTVYKTKDILVPVDTCSKATLPVRPKLPIYTLTEKDRGDYDKIVKYSKASLDILETHITILENQLKIYE